MAGKKVEDIPGTKPHQVYKLKNGTRVPGGSFVAHVAGAWQSGPFLVKWANNLGLQGYDSGKYRDKLADVGTVCHGMIENFFMQRPNDKLFNQFPGWVIDQAKICFVKFEKWAEHYDFSPILIERQFISEIYKFGGTPDYFGEIRHGAKVQLDEHGKCQLEECLLVGRHFKKILLDWKTCKYLYKSHLYQVAGYMTLLFENGYESDLVGIVRVGRNEEEGFQFLSRTSKDVLLQWEIFRVALQMLTFQNAEPKWLK